MERRGPQIRLRGVSKIYDEHVVLLDINVKLTRGHRIALVAAGTPLQAGEEIRVLAGASRPESVITVNAERKTSWAAGWLEFDGETAAEAVKTFNRFSDVNIEIRQPELAALRLTYHRFEIDKPQSFANSIARSLNTTVTRNPARKIRDVA